MPPLHGAGLSLPSATSGPTGGVRDFRRPAPFAADASTAFDQHRGRLRLSIAAGRAVDLARRVARILGSEVDIDRRQLDRLSGAADHPRSGFQGGPLADVSRRGRRQERTAA
jgi:hypothetical protein